MKTINKPKLVFFQKPTTGSAKFYSVLKQQHVKCLSQYFQVFVINEECDYQEMCDKYQPDLTLFESGIASYASQRNITNTNAYPEIPKLGFYNGDACCGFHSAFLTDMENWGIETFFAMSVPLAEYLPEISDKLFFWPNFLDSDVFKDYGQTKNIPLIITGSQSSLYPWRLKVSKIVSKYYPSLICPHLGYLDNRETSRMMFGEQYAKIINASWFSPACGSMARELVRKLLEIPGAKSCLITEKNATVEAAGFVDMQNCVFAEENNVLDKLDYLFENRDELEKIIDAGYELVHSRHTYKQRDQIWQWYSLYKQLKPNHKIVQKNPFEPMMIVESSSGINNSPIVVQALDRAFLDQGDEKLQHGKYEEAEALYIKCLNYVDYQAQPKLRLALCNLYQGNAATARYWLEQPIQWTLNISSDLTPDPVEWAYLIISFLCEGKLNEAVKCANQYPSLYHSELARTRWVINKLINKDTLPYTETEKHRYSAHQLPKRSFSEWLDNLYIMMTACHQFDLLNLLKDTDSKESVSFNEQRKHLNQFRNLVSSSIDALNIEPFITSLKQWLISNLKTSLRQPLTKLETKFGYFLPYQFSTIKSDELFQIIRKLVKRENIKTVLFVGAATGEVITEALLTSVTENPSKPVAFCVHTSAVKFNKIKKRLLNESNIKWYNISVENLNTLHQKVNKTINQIKQENNIKGFDALLIDASQLSTIIEESDNLCTYKLIILNNLINIHNYKNYKKLLSNYSYSVFAENPDLRNGYAIFERID